MTKLDPKQGVEAPPAETGMLSAAAHPPGPDPYTRGLEAQSSLRSDPKVSETRTQTAAAEITWGEISGKLMQVALRTRAPLYEQAFRRQRSRRGRLQEAATVNEVDPFT